MVVIGYQVVARKEYSLDEVITHLILIIELCCPSAAIYIHQILEGILQSIHIYMSAIS